MPTYTGFARDGGVTRVNEREMARMFYAAGATGAAFTSSSFAVTAIGGSRRVSVGLGTLSACGIIAVRDTAADVALVDVPQPPKDKGQNFVLVARFDWYRRLVTFEWLTGTITNPLTAATMQRDPGSYFDVPIAWVWASYAFTTLKIVDLRVLPDGRPATMAIDGGFWEEERTRNDLLAAGQRGSVVDKTWDVPRGVYTVTAISSISTAEAAAAVGNAFLLVNDDEVVHVRSDQDFSARPTTLARVVAHPGGALRVQSGYRDGSLTTQTIASSTVHAAYTRPYPI